MQPLVSIIIPTYNRARLIGETIDSVLAQTYENWECIVVDDGSTDATNELMEFYTAINTRIKYFRRPPDRPKGANACRNFGFEMSEGAFVNWFDDDDVMLEDFISEKITTIGNCELVICRGYICDENLGKIGELNFTKNLQLFKGLITWQHQIITNSVLFRTDFLKDKALFNLKISRGQEVELFSRLFFQLPISKFRLVNNSLFLYRQHSATKTYNNAKFKRNFVSSQSYNMVENYKRGLILMDVEVIEYCYKYLVKFLFSSLRNYDQKMTLVILIKILKTIKFRNFLNSFEILSVGLFLILIKKASTKFEKRWKNFKPHNLNNEKIKNLSSYS